MRKLEKNQIPLSTETSFFIIFLLIVIPLLIPDFYAQ